MRCSTMFLLVIMLTTVHGEWNNYMEGNFTDKEIFIQNGNFGLYLFQAVEEYHVVLMDNGGENQSAFSYPIESGLYLR